MNDWPGWAKLVAGLGFPMAVAIYLLVYASPKLESLEDIHNRQAELLHEHIEDTRVETVLLRAICRNTAKTELQAQFCDYGLPRWQMPAR